LFHESRNLRKVAQGFRAAAAAWHDKIRAAAFDQVWYLSGHDAIELLTRHSGPGQNPGRLDERWRRHYDGRIATNV
jgi:hypothetical protein